MGLADQLQEALMPADTPEIIAARAALRAAKADVERLSREAVALYTTPESDPRVRLNKSQQRAADRAVAVADKAYRTAIKAARAAPGIAAKLSRTQRLGVCQICSFGYELRNHVLVHHGWREHGGGKGLGRGFRHGVCPGAGYSPLQISCARAKDYAHELRITIARLEEKPELTAEQSKEVKSMKLAATELEAMVERWKPDSEWAARAGYRGPK